MSSAALALPASQWAMAGENTPELTSILARIKPPSFPNRDFDIAKYGAVSDGQIDKDKMALLDTGNKDVPVEQRVFGDGHHLRPNFVQPYRYTNVILDGFTIKRSPMWELNPVLCKNVVVRNITIDSPRAK